MVVFRRRGRNVDRTRSREMRNYNAEDRTFTSFLRMANIDEATIAFFWDDLDL